jgi:NRAMP (natural resistance-associated macrophage protein)-like metal ion transporter
MGLRDLGPGLLTGVADDDPSNIATYSQVGARFGYQMIWTLWVFYPLVAVIQQVSAEMARATGKGLAANLRDHYPPWVGYSLVATLLVANVINIGADLMAMGGAARLLFGGLRLSYAAGFLVIIVTLEALVRYERYARVLEVLSLALLAYVATAFSVRVDWHQALLGFLPTLMPGHHYATALVAIAGTTISPYLLFWQAGQEAEITQRDATKAPLIARPAQAPRELRRIRFDTYIGMALSQIVAFFIIVTAAATLGAHGIVRVDTASAAAQALAPLAGPWTSAVFAAGLVATGLLAIPAMAAACAYALAGMLRWPQGLGAPIHAAPRFYLVLVLVCTAGLGIVLLPFNSMRALYLSAALNGLVAVPLLAFMMILARRRSVMGRFVITTGSLIVGWAATLVMAAAALVLVDSWIS